MLELAGRAQRFEKCCIAHTHTYEKTANKRVNKFRYERLDREFQSIPGPIIVDNAAAKKSRENQLRRLSAGHKRGEGANFAGT